MNGESAILAAQYAGQGGRMLYMNAAPGYWAAIIIVGILLIVAIILIILDLLTKENETTWKEVYYDYRGMGEERSQDRDGEGEKVCRKR